MTEVSSFGLMRIGAAILALPVEAIREVVACPAELAAFPGAGEGVIGALRLRGTVLPVVDLAAALGLKCGAASDGVVVVMRCDSHLVGLRVHAVCGIGNVRARDMRHVSFTGPCTRPSLVTHSFEHGADVVALLDARRIAALPDIPLVEEIAPGSVNQALDGADPILLFRIGALRFGVHASIVQATTPRISFTPSALESGLCLGVIDHHGVEIPVVDMLRALSVGGGERAREGGVLILRYPSGASLGFALDDVVDIVRPAVSDLMPMPRLATAGSDLFRGVLPGEHGTQYFILDGDALIAHEWLSSLARFSRLKVASPSGAVQRSSASVSTERYLLYSCVGLHASLLAQIAEITPYPSRVAGLCAGQRGLLGLFDHRGVAIPLFCLATLIGGPSAVDPASARVLLVKDGDRIAGFVVEGLQAIESGHLPAQAASGSRWNEPQQRLEDCTVQIVEEGRRLVSRLDLFALLDAIDPGVVPAVSSAERRPFALAG